MHMALHVIFSFVFCYLFFIAMQAEAESLEPREDIRTGHVHLHCPASGEESAGHTWKCLAHSCHGVDNTGLRDLNFVGTFL